MVQITDELLGVRYYAASKHFHPVDKSEFEPISPEVAEVDKKIIVSLGKQTLTALKAGETVFRCKISSGSRYTETPAGQFWINRKFPSRHMGYGSLTSSITAYELPGVPWVSFFGDSGRFHGTTA
jgi:hypothetical protein